MCVCLTRLRPEGIEVERQKAEMRPVTRFSIKREDMDRHGFTALCPGCRAILRNSARQGRSEEWRNRLAKEMRGEEGRREPEAGGDFLAKRVEESDRKRNRAAESEDIEVDRGPRAGSPGDALPAPSSAGHPQAEKRKAGP